MPEQEPAPETADIPLTAEQVHLKASVFPENGAKLKDVLGLADVVSLKPAEAKLKAPRLPDGEA